MNATQMEDLALVSKSALTPLDLLIVAVKAVILFQDSIALVRMCTKCDHFSRQSDTWML